MHYQDYDYEAAKKAGLSDEDIQHYLKTGKDPYKKKPSPKYDIPKKEASGWEKIKSNASNFYNNLFNPAEFPEEEEAVNPTLLKQMPEYDVQAALKAGISPKEINKYIEKTIQEERTPLQKAGRIAGQFALGLAEANPLGIAYDLGMMPLATKPALNQLYREDLSNELENMEIQRESGQWNEEQEGRYQHLKEQMQNPRRSEEFVDPQDTTIRGLAEEATGLDLRPQGIVEKAVGWTAFIKDPKKFLELGKVGVNLKSLSKAIAPTGTEILRGVGAGIALQAAEEGQYGPIGAMAAVIAGDVIGAGVGRAGKKLKNLITRPKETIAKEVAKTFTKKDKMDLQKEIIQDFRKSGLQADLGTITDNDLIRWMQSRLAQSGLAGKDLAEFKTEFIDQVKREYKSIAEMIGEARFQNTHEAGEILKNAVKEIRDADLGKARGLYQKAESLIKENSFVNPKKLSESVIKIEKALKPGAIKSTEQKAVLEVLDKLKRDIYDSSGSLIGASVKDLINNKIALNDIINYEIQGGTKQLLKGLVADLDRAIISHGKENPAFAKNYIQANKKFSEHAKTFRNKNIDKVLFAHDPDTVIKKMDSIQGIRDIQKALGKSAEGTKLFEDIKRFKLDSIVGDNLVDGVTGQANLGKFSNLLDKGKNRIILKEILDPKSFKRLELLQKNAGLLAQSANKFYNASKSGVIAVDAAIIAKGMGAVAGILSGNPWPLMKIGGGVIATNRLGKLLADPEFLKLTEDIILASKKGSQSDLWKAFENVRPYIVTAINEGVEGQDEDENEEELFNAM